MPRKPHARSVQMTKINWDKADRYDLDPGAVRDGPEIRDSWTPPQEARRKAAQRAERKKELSTLRFQQYLQYLGAKAAARARAIETDGSD